MQGDNRDENAARVRHVPILIESRRNRPDRNNINDDYDDEQMIASEQPQQQHGQGNFSQRPQGAHNRYPRRNNTNYQYSSQTLPNTSSIDINYRPPSSQQRNQKQQQYDDHRFDGVDTNKQEATNLRRSKSNERTNLEKGRSSSSRMDSPANSANQNSDKLVNSPVPIPLPPPPEQQEENTTKNYNHKQQDHQQTKQNDNLQDADEKKPKKGPDPLDLIKSTKIQVATLLDGIVTFKAESFKSKPYIHYEEMLTRCILKLDDINCQEFPELRQQRKDVIHLIERCTDILQRKVQLNYDIIQLSEKIHCDVDIALKK